MKIIRIRCAFPMQAPASGSIGASAISDSFDGKDFLLTQEPEGIVVSSRLPRSTQQLVVPWANLRGVWREKETTVLEQGAASDAQLKAKNAAAPDPRRVA